MRGEKSQSHKTMFPAWGSPPRARGKATRKAQRLLLCGITPACAGKSYPSTPRRYPFQDHPRVRGEKLYGKWDIFEGQGSPPRARGKVTTEKE